MKLLLFSDVHTNLAACEKLVAMAEAADVVIGAGDFASVHNGLEPTIQALSHISAPAIIVPGNNETEDALRDVVSNTWPEAIVLHGQGTIVEGVPFFGIGGGIPITPFGDWSFDLTEDDARAKLADCPHGAVLVSHSPPKGHGDRTSRGVSCGSEAVLETIQATSPRLVVCGHIHDSWGYDGIEGTTRIINAGPKGVTVDM